MFTFLVSLLFLFAAPAQQTTTPNPADLCTIQGVVVKAGTGEPLGKATVEALPAHNPPQPTAAVADAETDAMGRFELKGLAPGRYRLLASRNGFVRRQQYGQRTPDELGTMLTLSAGQKISGIILQLIPAAVITGHVYDQDGEPAVDATVRAMHYAYRDGLRQLMGTAWVGGGKTNDLGEFRIFGLPPGQYFVQATLRTNQTANAKTKQGYVPVYYPGVPDANRATPVTVQGGNEFSGVDISLHPVRAVTVRGNVINTGCEATPVVFLAEWSASHNFGERFMRPVNAQATFQFSNITPGSYYLFTMFSEQCFGLQALEVGDSNIDGVTLTVTRGVEIKGHLRVEGQTDPNLTSLTVSLAPKVTFMPYGGPTSDPAKSDGSFLFKNTYDGDYEIDVGNLPESYFLKSARLDGVDVLTAGVTVDSKQPPGLLEIVVSPNGASVDGVISKDQQPFQGATVALVPDPPHRGEGWLFRDTITDQNGHFVLQGIAPGDYKVFAWEKIAPDAYTSPEFLQPFENRGESVHITEGSRNSVQVEMIPAKDAGQ